MLAVEVEFVRELQQPAARGSRVWMRCPNPGGVAPVPQCFSSSLRAASSYDMPPW